MRKKTLIFLIAALFFTGELFSQKLGKPSLTPTEATAKQRELIERAISLHDQRKYDEAIRLYEEVLKENPDCDLALYEAAFSLFYKRDYEGALNKAYKLVKYKSKTGILGYGLIANILDDQGEPKKAIEIYQDAIKILKDDPNYDNHVSSLYYNLAVTYFRQKNFKDSKDAAKKAIEYDFSYPSPNLLVSEIFFGLRYKIPALLASARMISLEADSERTKRSYRIFKDVLNGGATKNDKGGININLDFNAPKDEGDFGSLELFMGFGAALEKGESEKKTAEQSFIESVDTLIVNIEADEKKNKSTFSGKYYYPFMIEMKKKGYVEAFGYVILSKSGSQEAEKWVLSNSQKVLDFFDWAKKYQPNVK